MDVTIDEHPIDVPGRIVTWGELLDWIETDYLKAGRCIRNVYLGGTEACNYRDRFVCDQDLKSIGTVAVRSDDFNTVVHESLSELTHALDTALVEAKDIVRTFENRNEELAYNRLAQLLGSIRVFFNIFFEDLGWVEPEDTEISRKEFSAVMERTLVQLISAQEAHNWVSVCDVLEYEITPILEAWQKMVARTLERLN